MQFVDDVDKTVITYVNQSPTGNKVMAQKTVIHRYVPMGQQQIRHELIKPSIPIEFWEMMHDFSMFLIVDDQHDLGKFDYYGDRNHYYRFRKSPDHPSPFHHYQVGIVGLFVSQIGALISKALDIKNELSGNPHPIPEVYRLPKKEKIITIPQPIDPLPSLPERSEVGDKSPVFRKLSKALDAI